MPKLVKRGRYLSGYRKELPFDNVKEKIESVKKALSSAIDGKKVSVLRENVKLDFNEAWKTGDLFRIPKEIEKTERYLISSTPHYTKDTNKQHFFEKNLSILLSPIEKRAADVKNPQDSVPKDVPNEIGYNKKKTSKSNLCTENQQQNRKSSRIAKINLIGNLSRSNIEDKSTHKNSHVKGIANSSNKTLIKSPQSIHWTRSAVKDKEKSLPDSSVKLPLVNEREKESVISPVKLSHEKINLLKSSGKSSSVQKTSVKKRRISIRTASQDIVKGLEVNNNLQANVNKSLNKEQETSINKNKNDNKNEDSVIIYISSSDSLNYTDGLAHDRTHFDTPMHRKIQPPDKAQDKRQITSEKPTNVSVSTSENTQTNSDSEVTANGNHDIIDEPGKPPDTQNEAESNWNSIMEEIKSKKNSITNNQTSSTNQKPIEVRKAQAEIPAEGLAPQSIERYPLVRLRGDGTNPTSPEQNHEIQADMSEEDLSDRNRVVNADILTLTENYENQTSTERKTRKKQQTPKRTTFCGKMSAKQSVVDKNIQTEHITHGKKLKTALKEAKSSDSNRIMAKTKTKKTPRSNETRRLRQALVTLQQEKSQGEKEADGVTLDSLEQFALVRLLRKIERSDGRGGAAVERKEQMSTKSKNIEIPSEMSEETGRNRNRITHNNVATAANTKNPTSTEKRKQPSARLSCPGRISTRGTVVARNVQTEHEMNDEKSRNTSEHESNWNRVLEEIASKEKRPYIENRKSLFYHRKLYVRSKRENKFIHLEEEAEPIEVEQRPSWGDADDESNSRDPFSDAGSSGRGSNLAEYAYNYRHGTAPIWDVYGGGGEQVDSSDGISKKPMTLLARCGSEPFLKRNRTKISCNNENSNSAILGTQDQASTTEQDQAGTTEQDQAATTEHHQEGGSDTVIERFKRRRTSIYNRKGYKPWPPVRQSEEDVSKQHQSIHKQRKSKHNDDVSSTDARSSSTENSVVPVSSSDQELLGVRPLENDIVVNDVHFEANTSSRNKSSSKGQKEKRSMSMSCSSSSLHKNKNTLKRQKGKASEISIQDNNTPSCSYTVTSKMSTDDINNHRNPTDNVEEDRSRFKKPYPKNVSVGESRSAVNTDTILTEIGIAAKPKTGRGRPPQVAGDVARIGEGLVSDRRMTLRKREPVRNLVILDEATLMKWSEIMDRKQKKTIRKKERPRSKVLSTIASESGTSTTKAKGSSKDDNYETTDREIAEKPKKRGGRPRKADIDRPRSGEGLAPPEKRRRGRAPKQKVEVPPEIRSDPVPPSSLQTNDKPMENKRMSLKTNNNRHRTLTSDSGMGTLNTIDSTNRKDLTCSIQKKNTISKEQAQDMNDQQLPSPEEENLVSVPEESPRDSRIQNVEDVAEMEPDPRHGRNNSRSFEHSQSSSQIGDYGRNPSTSIDNHYINYLLDNEPISFKFVYKIPTETEYKRLGRIDVTQSINMKNVFSFGYIRLQPGDSKPPTFSTNYHLIYDIMTGKAAVQCNNRKILIHQGEGFSIPLGIEYSIHNIDNQAELLMKYTKIQKHPV